MGYLHEGHLSLVRRALAENDMVGVSVFVNPTQFGPSEDLDEYPRDLERDLSMLEALRVDLVFAPSAEDMYPPGYQTSVNVEQVTRPLEGAARPGHFRGVATVVAKLFNIFQPGRAYFGQKDAQQVVVIQQMVRDLDFPIDVVVCPTVREEDGLAMSSRNVRLSPAERQAATVLNRALSVAAAAAVSGQRSAERLRQIMRTVLASEPLAELEYVSVADRRTLDELEHVGQEGALLSLAVRFGDTRLIDNWTVEAER
jgi:pantoate--beta-alanine ligase